MGRWTTLHLFDDKLFYLKVVPELKGEKGNLENVYLNFLKTHMVGGIDKFTQNEIQTLIRKSLDEFQIESQKFDIQFKHHKEFDLKNSTDSNKLYSSSWYYDFCRFFEYYVFHTCADFYPHIPCGKYGVVHKFDIDYKLIGFDVLLEFSSFTFFAHDGTGIDGWITNEDVELLYYERDLLILADDEFQNPFLQLLQIAYDNKLGLLLGGDMREDTLESLPKFKLLQ